MQVTLFTPSTCYNRFAPKTSWYVSGSLSLWEHVGKSGIWHVHNHVPWSKENPLLTCSIPKSLLNRWQCIELDEPYSLSEINSSMIQTGDCHTHCGGWWYMVIDHCECTVMRELTMNFVWLLFAVVSFQVCGPSLATKVCEDQRKLGFVIHLEKGW